MKRTALILVAAGKGTRAGTEIPKQYQRIGEKQLIAYTLENLQKSFSFDEIRVVVSKNDVWIDDILQSFGLVGVTTIGGATRTNSVHSGLKSLENLGIDRVFIHDAARPFVSQPLLEELNRALDSADSAAPALQIADGKPHKLFVMTPLQKRSKPMQLNRAMRMILQSPTKLDYLFTLPKEISEILR